VRTNEFYDCANLISTRIFGALAIGLVTSIMWEPVRAETGNCNSITNRDPKYLNTERASHGITPNRDFTVVNRLPHDREAFTQGLVFHQGYIYESTGLIGLSTLRKIDPGFGRIIRRRSVSTEAFAEGLAVLNEHLLQLTWHSGTGFLYTPDLNLTDTVSYSGTSWGGVSVNARLVISDGSSWLEYRHPQSLRTIKKLQVTNQGRPLEGLNELEYVDGLIYANIYPTDCIAQIDPNTGRVKFWLDLSGLLPLSKLAGPSAIANGIAYNAITGNLFVTGKFWPYIFELKLMKEQP